MKIEIILGTHLTAKDLKSIKQMIQQNLLFARVGRTDYILSQLSNSSMQVTKIVKDRGLGLIGTPLQISKYLTTIRVTA